MTQKQLLADQCFRKWYNYFFKLSYSITLDREATKDIIQDAFVYVLNYDTKEITEMEHMKALCIISIRFASHDFINSRKSIPTIKPEPVSISNYLLDMWPASTGIFKNISKLTINQQSLIKKHFWEGKGFREIQIETGIGEVPIRNAIQRGVSFLRKGCVENHKVPDNRDGNMAIIINLVNSGLKARQIAEKLNRPVSTIGSRVNYYKNKFPEMFKQAIA
jgi:DNA-directed RNA polymerase specialized sigma24 family protein